MNTQDLRNLRLWQPSLCVGSIKNRIDYCVYVYGIHALTHLCNYISLNACMRIHIKHIYIYIRGEKQNVIRVRKEFLIFECIRTNEFSIGWSRRLIYRFVTATNKKIILRRLRDAVLYNYNTWIRNWLEKMYDIQNVQGNCKDYILIVVHWSTTHCFKRIVQSSLSLRKIGREKK